VPGDKSLRVISGVNLIPVFLLIHAILHISHHLFFHSRFSPPVTPSVVDLTPGLKLHFRQHLPYNVVFSEDQLHVVGLGPDLLQLATAFARHF